ncbi:MAG: hypothetical protein OHK0046_51180 [Anaerolineae bacterium]
MAQHSLRIASLMRNDTIRDILRGVPYVLFGLIMGLALLGHEYFLHGQLLSFFTNIWTEWISIILTVSILNRMAERREDKRRLDDLRRQLVRDVGGRDNLTALNALREMRERDWLNGTEGVLKAANLEDAELQGADLRGAILRRANLNTANLNKADLREADLRRAVLRDATLRGANLSSANFGGAQLQSADLSTANLRETSLRGAFLWRANLAEALLMKADLRGADLFQADLRGAYLGEADLRYAFVGISETFDSDGRRARTLFDENTMLPDHTKWTPDTDLTRFGVFTDQRAYDHWRKTQSQSQTQTQTATQPIVAVDKRVTRV